MESTPAADPHLTDLPRHATESPHVLHTFFVEHGGLAMESPQPTLDPPSDEAIPSLWPAECV